MPMLNMHGQVVEKEAKKRQMLIANLQTLIMRTMNTAIRMLQIDGAVLRKLQNQGSQMNHEKLQKKRVLKLHKIKNCKDKLQLELDNYKKSMKNEGARLKRYPKKLVIYEFFRA